MGSANASIMTLQESLAVAINNLISSFIIFIPRLLIAVLILFIGLVVAGWVKSLIKQFLHALSANKLVENSPVDRFFTQGSIPLKIEEGVGELCRWIVIYLFLIATFSIIGLQSVSALLTQLFDFIPKIISAILIFILGILAAGLVESLVKNAVGSFDISTGRLMGKVMSYTMMVFASLAAISELGIASFFINTLFIGFVALLTIGVGLAFGLGAKDVIREMLMQWYKRQKE